jgi:hypothetical protein
MSYYVRALQLDIYQRYPEALIEYEKSIACGEHIIDAYINVAFIYWRSAVEFCWADACYLPNWMRGLGGARYVEILDLAADLFPEVADIYFWRRYLEHRSIYTDFEEHEVIDIIVNYKLTSMDPYFFAYLFDEEKYKAQRDDILRACAALPICKYLYVKPIIEDRPWERTHGNV